MLRKNGLHLIVIQIRLHVKYAEIKLNGTFFRLFQATIYKICSDTPILISVCYKNTGRKVEKFVTENFYKIYIN